MLETLRQWLNGNREYTSGVALYAKLNHNEKLLAVMKKGKTDWCYQKLQEELLAICNEMKGTVAPSQPIAAKPTTNHLPLTATNPDLYAACKKEADLFYKELMNSRAILFAHAKGDKFDNPNLPDKIAQRSKMAIDIVKGYQKVSALYDRADYVFKNGRLPTEETTNEDTYHALPDELVKQTLDNCRKNYNKKKKLDETPERVAALQLLQVDIAKLEARWNKLKPVKS